MIKYNSHFFFHFFFWFGDGLRCDEFPKRNERGAEIISSRPRILQQQKKKDKLWFVSRTLKASNRFPKYQNELQTFVVSPTKLISLWGSSLIIYHNCEYSLIRLCFSYPQNDFALSSSSIGYSKRSIVNRGKKEEIRCLISRVRFFNNLMSCSNSNQVLIDFFVRFFEAAFLLNWYRGFL